MSSPLPSCAEMQALPVETYPRTPCVPVGINEGAALAFLQSQRWPTGLQLALLQITRTTPMHFFICDNSGSMTCFDTRRLLNGTDPISAYLSRCSRWTELDEMLKFHAQLAEVAQHPVEFHFLNGHDPIVVGAGTDDSAGLDKLRKVLATTPAGHTPLCQHLRVVEERIRQVEAELRARSQNAMVVIATDGLSTDGDVVTAIRSLANLPVLVTVRLCTEVEQVVQYWNEVDRQLSEMKIGIVEDFTVEGRQVHRFNPWLTYGEPLQRLREFGLRQKELDFAQQRRLSPDEMKRICALLLFHNMPNELCDPVTDFKGFIDIIRQANLLEGDSWDPYLKRARHWVSTGSLKAHYHRRWLCRLFRL